MNELIRGMIKPDQLLEIAFLSKCGTSDIFRGHFITSDNSAIAIRLGEDRIRLLELTSVSYIDILSDTKISAESNKQDSRSADAIAESAEEEQTEDADTTNAGLTHSHLYSNTPQLSAPKVVGRIELNNMGSTSRFRRPTPEITTETTHREYDTQIIPGMGRVSRLGPNFGFIQPNDPDAPSIFMPRGEIITIHGLMRSPNVGDEVIYTPSTNRQGQAAKCIHLACSLGTLEDMAERLANYDPRNASILRARINAVNDGTPLEEVTIEPYQRRPRPITPYQPALDASTVLAMVARGEEVSARDISECENSLTEVLSESDYVNYIKALDRLLGYSMKRNMTVVHRLFSRAIRVAREANDINTALRFVRTACDFYQHQPGNYKFFSAIEYRLTHQPQNPDDDDMSDYDDTSDEDVTETTQAPSPDQEPDRTTVADSESDSNSSVITI